jgi:hypothetical protein
VLSLLVIPTFYEIVDGFRSRMTRLASRFIGGAEAWRPKTGEHPVPTEG